MNQKITGVCWLLLGGLLLLTVVYQNNYQAEYRMVHEDTKFTELDDNRTEYVIYICDGKNLCGGYGDRQKGIVASYLISVMMNRRFGIILNHPCEFGQMFSPNQVNWKVDESLIRNKTSKRITAIDGNSDRLRKSMMNMTLDQEYKEAVLYFSINLEFVYYLRQNTKYENQLKWLKHLSISEIYNVVLRRLFKLKPHLQEKLDPFSKLKKQGIKLIGAQIRIGRNPSIPNDSAVRNNINNTKVLWKFYDKYNERSKFRIFISTDSDQVRQRAKSLFPDVYLEVPGKVVHVERTEKNSACKGWGKVILDQMVLSLCDVLVVSKSGFGRIAAFLRQNENELYCLKLDEIRRCTTQSEIFCEKSW